MNNFSLKILIKKVTRGFVDALYVKDINSKNLDAELNKNIKYGLCENCLSTLNYNNKRICYKCGVEITGAGSYCIHCKDSENSYDFARAPFNYTGTIKNLIYKLKYSNAKYLKNYLGYFLVDEYIKAGFNADIVIPVSMSEERRKERGYNQAYLLCEKLQEVLGLEVSDEILIRHKDTPHQTNLTKKERESNLKDAFKVIKKDKIKNKNILLVDDVFTTGSTAEWCSKELKKAGAKNVFVLTLAHVSLNAKNINGIT